MHGKLTIYLDGTRSVNLTLPSNWEELRENQQRPLIQPEMDELLANSMAWQVDTEEN